jgi:hypothetical protein
MTQIHFSATQFVQNLLSGLSDTRGSYNITESVGYAFGAQLAVRLFQSELAF